MKSKKFLIHIKKQENTTHGEEKNKSIEKDPEMTANTISMQEH